MSKFKIVNRIIDGKNVEVEIGNNTLQYVLTNRLTGMRSFGQKKHRFKVLKKRKKAKAVKSLKTKALKMKKSKKS